MSGIIVYQPGQLLPPADAADVSALAAAAPAHMAEDRDVGMTEIRKYLRPARIKVVQQKRSEAYQDFDEGVILLVPEKRIVVQREEPFFFVPVFFYTEYCVVNDYRLKDQEPMIRERTLDPNSMIARASRNPDTREVSDPKRIGDPKGYKIRNTEYLVYLSIIVRTPGLQATPVAISFSRGEYGMGQQLAGLCNSRRPNPMFGCVFQGVVPKQQRHRSVGDWYGIAVTNPDTSVEGTPGPWVETPEEYAQFKALHYDLAEKHASMMIQVDHEDPEDQPATSAAGEAKF